MAPACRCSRRRLASRLSRSVSSIAAPMLGTRLRAQCILSGIRAATSHRGAAAIIDGCSGGLDRLLHRIEHALPGLAGVMSRRAWGHRPSWRMLARFGLCSHDCSAMPRMLPLARFQSKTSAGEEASFCPDAPVAYGRADALFGRRVKTTDRWRFRRAPVRALAARARSARDCQMARRNAKVFSTGYSYTKLPC
jgi:hypothetical protein